MLSRNPMCVEHTPHAPCALEKELLGATHGHVIFTARISVSLASCSIATFIATKTLHESAACLASCCLQLGLNKFDYSKHTVYVTNVNFKIH